jgi:hypothetical protein
MPLPSVKIPAGYKITISLQNASGNITAVTFLVIDNLGNTLANKTPAVPSEVAPIIAFELDLVGPINGETAVLSSGAGTFTYTASSPLTALQEVPSGAPGKKLDTGEKANSVYGVLPANACSRLVQSFIVGPSS